MRHLVRVVWDSPWEGQTSREGLQTSGLRVQTVSQLLCWPWLREELGLAFLEADLQHRLWRGRP